MMFAASSASARTWQEGVAGLIPGVAAPGCSPRFCDYVVPPMPYRYYLPSGYDPAVAYPMVLFLHGSGEAGTNNESQVRMHISSLINKTNEEYPAILVAPQIYPGAPWGSSTHDRVDEVLDILFDELSIDPNRLYLTGLSMGGFGTMTYLHDDNADPTSPWRFAAAAAAAGASLDPGLASVIRETPIWLAHGTNDTVVSVETSRSTYNGLIGAEAATPIVFDAFAASGPTAINGLTRYTEYPGVGHGSWVPFYASDDVYEWMFAQSLVPEPTTGMLVLSALTATALGRSRRFAPIRSSRPRG